MRDRDANTFFGNVINFHPDAQQYRLDKGGKLEALALAGSVETQETMPFDFGEPQNVRTLLEFFGVRSAIAASGERL